MFSKSSFSTSTTNVGGNNNSGLGSDSGGGGSKLASARAAAVINLLASYLLDARSITQYHPITSPHGALQLSVAENQLSELNVEGLVGILEGGESSEGVMSAAGGIINNGKEGGGMKLVDVLSQLASSNVARSSSEGSGEGGIQNVFERDMIYYQPTQGVPSLRNVMADYLQRLLVTPPSTSSSSSSNKNKGKFNPDNLVL